MQKTGLLTLKTPLMCCDADMLLFCWFMGFILVGEFLDETNFCAEPGVGEENRVRMLLYI